MTSSPTPPRFPIHRLLSPIIPFLAITAFLLFDCLAAFTPKHPAEAQTTQSRAMTLRSDVQEANAKTGVVTARGNVQINYPARQIQATAAQAQYFSRERRIVLSGNVYVLQEGNSMRGETITYLIDEGRFVALPQPPKQVESIYLVPENNPIAPSPAASPPPFGPQSEFSPPASTQSPDIQLEPRTNTPLPPNQR
ncbi:LptA/OstA family protein [Leptothermofonsia sp. ETS-13]|uniref:LptA/OstA family protein n=1 Tax=Leptothermofonsia sp. ETS-13 TaxID=3035696 RepID=UPI003B9E4821